MTLRDDQTSGLLQRARAGDEAAFNALVNSVRDKIFRWALIITGDSDDAEDVTQQVTLKLHGKLAEFQERSRLTTWLYTITRNTALDMINKPARKREESLSEDTVTELSDDVDVKITRLDNQRAASVVRAFFTDLPPRQRELIELIDNEGCTAGEAAQAMGIEPETARVHLLRARRTLRARMLEVHPEMLA
jgi:RNA polymerase sigma-70 factor (ECF subfamily)